MKKTENKQREAHFLKKNEFNFVYPFLVPKNEKLPYQGCPWIYDFQHKYLPNLFTQSDIEVRDRGFAQIADVSSRVVLSSQTAASDFQKFFPVLFTREICEAENWKALISFRIFVSCLSNDH